MFVSTWGTIPDSSSVALTESQNIFKNALGSTANLDPQSPNGLIIQQIANQIINSNSAEALLYNGVINPQVAPGIFLDAICAFNQISRFPATYTTVTCQCTGLSGTVIPAGSQVMDSNGNLFNSSVATIIPVSGTVNIVFTSITAGPIYVAIGAITKIVQTINGWDTVNNSAAGITGTNQESDYQLRVRRVNSLSKGSTGTFNALISNLSSSSDISDFRVLVNNTSSSTSFSTGLAPYNETISVPANSIHASIYGGTANEIGRIFYNTLNGCGTDGGTTITYTDPNYSFVTNTYKYQQPVATRLEVDVTLPGPSSLYPANITTLVQQAVYNNYYGLDGNSKVTMSNVIYVSRFEAAIVNATGVENITNVTMGVYTNAIYTTFQLPISKVGTLALSDVIVTII